MCGRYALALRPSQIRQMLQDEDMPVDEAPADDEDGGPRQSYNFAPGYHGVVYRADVPDWGAGPRSERSTAKAKAEAENETEHAAAAAGGGGGDVDGGHEDDDLHDNEDEQHNNSDDNDDHDDDATKKTSSTHYKLQSMKWGLIPFWTKRNPDYGAVMKTINCRDDSLAAGGGGGMGGRGGGSMWNAIKGRKRCIVIAQGFYEWLKHGKEKVPHFVKRKDGRLMCLAGLWDVVQYEGESSKNYTYTIITTSSNAQLAFLHDRMPVILEPGSTRLATWLDPARCKWSAELQGILQPFEGELEVYPVSKEVGKVGNNSPSFIIPVASRENKANIANFFANARAKKTKGMDEEEEAKTVEKSVDEVAAGADDGGMGQITSTPTKAGTKRKADEVEVEVEIQPTAEKDEPPKKKDTAAKTFRTSPPPTKGTRMTTRLSTSMTTATPKKTAISAPAKETTKRISATSNGTKRPAKGKAGGTPKITKFFGNSA
ncbi:hypothetical protein BD289DRAFT_438501 [Coniella lustricola]|uniref:DUF159 domain protein n=1 Tax=Coniella lustricola TaxID=2025994 RepID=A0A2T3A2S3_9PEZI|nr:hypothetical protein BD289DRAFT_438501 [Coniella lustricola]